MGASDFRSYAYGKTAQDAFKRAVTEAQYEHGHGGYTGTIAEKSGFCLLKTVKSLTEARTVCESTIETNDKWGPAFAVEVLKLSKEEQSRLAMHMSHAKKRGEKLFVFFGIASI